MRELRQGQFSEVFRKARTRAMTVEQWISFCQDLQPFVGSSLHRKK